MRVYVGSMNSSACFFPCFFFSKTPTNKTVPQIFVNFGFGVWRGAFMFHLLGREQSPHLSSKPLPIHTIL